MAKRTLEISEETYELIKDQLKETEKKEINHYDDLIGEKLFIRTVTYHLVGEVEARVGSFLKLKKASWVADSGRFYNCLAEGTLNEVEPAGRDRIAFVNLDSVTDFFFWNHPLPTEQK